MGSAALAHCAMRGARALGIEQFEPVHELGASSGKTRIIRQAYFENAAYVPLLIRSYELWRDLERSTGEDLMRLTGLLMVGTPEGEIVAGALHAARAYGLSIEHLNAREIRSRYPQVLVHDGEAGVFEARGGVVFPERAIRAHLDLARARGAHARFHTAMQTWTEEADFVSVRFSDGTQVKTRSLVLTLGPWFTDALREAGIALEIQRNVQVWFTPAEPSYRAGAFPAFLIEREGLPAPLYGFPDFGDGVKAAFHGCGERTTPQMLRRELDPASDVEPVARALESWMPGAARRYREAKVCMYALTPDRHFVVDRHPRSARVVLCGGFSGHGFKFAPVVGEIAAQLALDGETPRAIGFLSARRFTQ